jgi:hemerythrin-like domain-containing protein
MTMSHVTDAVRKHHRQLAETLDNHVKTLADTPEQTDPHALVAFLRTELAPHATGEENAFYPAIDPLLREHGQPTATMHIDHEFIADYIGELEDAVDALEGTNGAERVALEARVRELAFKLEAIWELHLTKEERVYLPLMEKFLSEAEQQGVLNKMHEAHGE